MVMIESDKIIFLGIFFWGVLILFIVIEMDLNFKKLKNIKDVLVIILVLVL